MDKRFYFLIFFGGGMGAALRVAMDAWLMKFFRHAVWPWGVMTVNLLGCLLLGVLYGCLVRDREGMASWVFPLLGAGMLGGFTTFSTFGMQTLTMLKEGRLFLAAGYVAVSVAGGVAMAALGYAASVWAGNSLR